MKKGRKIVKRDTTIDLLKGIGITSIVIGHVRSYLPGGFPIVAYVYTYHIISWYFYSLRECVLNRRIIFLHLCKLESD